MAALRIIRETRPDVVLMDVNMPGISGLQATAIIREEFPAVRVVVISVHGEAASSSPSGRPEMRWRARIIRETRPDVVLMDVNMPGISGLQATAIIREEPNTNGSHSRQERWVLFPRANIPSRD